MAETKKFCIHSDGLGYCDVLSDDTVHHYCVEGPCPHEIIVGYEPVKHGRWEECDWVEYDGHGECVHYPHEGCVCTNCRNAFKKEFVRNPRVNVCPHCGAKMDLEVTNGLDQH